MVVKQPRIRSGFPVVTRGRSTQPTRNEPSEAHVDGLLQGPPEIRAGRRTAGLLLIKSGQSN